MYELTNDILWFVEQMCQLVLGVPAIYLKTNYESLIFHSWLRTQ